VNFGGYEIVREISRSPLGLTGTARGPGAKGEVFFVHVQYLDPIANRGEERLVVEAFLEKARIQQQAAGEHWAKIHAVGEVDEGAFVVTDLYPRSAQSLINGRTRLSGRDLQRVAIGMLDGLNELAQRVEGRAHGTLDADDVLIDDRLGPGNWRVVLSGPSSEKWSKEDLDKARLRDARSVGSVLLGIVEHRQSRILPTRIDVSEAWKRVGGGQAGEWVAAVNYLLDADLDPSTDWLGSARSAFAAIKTRSTKRSKMPMIVGAVLLLAAAGGGAYFMMPRGVDPDELPDPDFDELTLDVWQEWVGTSQWVQNLESDLNQEWPDDERATLSPAARGFLEAVLAEVPSSKEIRNKKGETGYAWRPEKLFDSGPLFSDLFDADGRASDERRVELLATPGQSDVLAKANVVIKRVRRIREKCEAPAVREDLVTLVDRLRAWGAGDEQIASLDGSIADLSPESIDSSEDIIALVKAVDAGSRAGVVADELSALDDRISSVVALADDDAAEDPVLSRVRDIIHSSVTGSIPGGADAGAVYEQVRFAGGKAEAELESLSEALTDAYPDVVKSEFLRLFKSDLESKDGLLALGQWRASVKDIRVVALPSERDPVAQLRDPADKAKALDSLGQQVETVRELLNNDLLKPGDKDEIRTAIQELEGMIKEVDGRISDAVAQPLTIGNVQELNRANDEIRGVFRQIGNRTQKLINAHSNTPEKVIALLDAPDASFQDEPLLSAAMASTRDELRALAVEAKSLPEGERNARASQLRDRFEQEQDRLKKIQSLTSQRLDFPPTTVIDDPTWLYDAFNLRRNQIQRTLIESGEVPLESAGASLDTLAAEVEGAMSAATELVAQFDRWVRVDDLGDLTRIASPVFEGAAEMGGAFAKVVTPLQSRLDALGRLDETSARDLLSIASDPAASPELRRAAYERAGGNRADWPATAEDMRLALDARNALAVSIEETQTPAWSVAEVTQITQDLWRRAMENAKSQNDFVEVRAMRGDFGFTSETQAGLPVGVQRNAALIDLRAAIAGIERTDDPVADDQTVRVVVNTWLDEHVGLFDDQSDWIGKLRDALTAEASSGGDFDPSKYGPGSIGWGGTADEDIEVLTYRSTDGKSIGFRRVEVDDESVVWFLATEEASLGLFLALDPTGLADVEDDASNGPRGWIVDGNNKEVVPAEFWFDHLSVSSDFMDNPMFAPGLGAAGAETELAVESTEWKDEMPVQHVSLDLAESFCEDFGCVLPPVEVWRAATEKWYAQAGLGPVAVNASAAGKLRLEVRDSVWKTQLDYISGLGANGLGQHQQWKGGIFDQWGGNDAEIWSGIDDGHLYFAPVASESVSGAGSANWSHLVGNVAEIVSTGGGAFSVIGASAMSPSSVSVTQAVPIEGRFDLPASDVGFRPAFSVPAGELNPTAMRRVEVLVRDAPFEFSGG
jgi:hypothetical protein